MAEAFQSAGAWSENYITKRADKWIIDLERIIIRNLIKTGSFRRKVSGCRVCTKCHSDVFFHRGSQNQTGPEQPFNEKRLNERVHSLSMVILISFVISGCSQQLQNPQHEPITGIDDELRLL